MRPSAGVGNDAILYETKIPFNTSDWSHDGNYIAFDQFGGPSAQSDIWILPLNGEKKPFPYLQTAFSEYDGRFSPDGRWIVYSSNETGQQEVYLRPFPGPGSALKVSTGGGSTPAWSTNGREVFYVSLDNKMMSAEIRSRGSTTEVGAVRALFARTPIMSEYEPFADGKRFLMNRLIEPKETDPITLVVNWNAGLKK